ncbi:tRNA pseudouridine(38-40) synthase TruA [Candidatus Palibaumannia cicadellinicola]|uniref:tRNA pseudouridine synthase A n=1 Tax=Baumannia cicadellinicola subsp. Homalodisca coagulata TaxID=374463 RepID=Q1LTA6_BAUCH|nr:tRNA pseudouridine(38-40) synthase TruA [Candidatus Baumannia cicadellinicola]ABF14323.1 tRNA pseudouridine synthase A [Baumannia cicadellinicola str. Hc (Homalodisca coagulata)]MCJ7462210.1 tRNA pseudouridine(38-40) synthase TruA [Candidatus Baumannia cicadellinicola]MCJ7462728.1 tRNA pseudouridine(38-40) synthase TruA [Candidatus Baumannia cicadellinicola]
MANKHRIKIALGIAYNGSLYYGWQRQKELPSVQASLERALSIVANEKISVFCAGRTDTGVHATGQVVHFETVALRTNKAWTLGVNANLPASIAVRWAMTVTLNFHARFSATARSYRYIIYNHPLRPAMLGSSGYMHFYQPLDPLKMDRAGQCLLGERDFTSFRAQQCTSRTPWRNLHQLIVKRHGSYIIVDITANAFLYRMVRNIVGCLIEIGSGKKPENWIADLLARRDRSLAGITARAKGLYLVNVYYPSEFALPSVPVELFFLI